MSKRNPESQKEEELALLSGRKIRLEQNKGIKENIEDVNLSDYVKGKFYDHRLLNAISNKITLDFFMPTDPTESRTLVKTIFKNMKQIGAKSVEGYVLIGDFGEAGDLFVVKGPQNPKYDNLLHEWFIAEMGTNRLREELPNFAYVYGSFRCTPAVIKNKKLVEWCDVNAKLDEEVHYVMYETIKGTELAELNKTTSFQDYLANFLQILYALEIAANEFRFTHYDLHTENVLCRTISKEGFIPYMPKKDDKSYVIYLKTKCVPTIIDFGRSHIKIDNKHFGIYGFEKYGIFPDKARPLYDVYKLLGFSLDDMRRAKNPTFDEAVNLLKLFYPKDFTKEQLTDVVISGYDTYYKLSKTIDKYERETNIIDLIGDIVDMYPEETSKIIYTKKDLPKNAKIYDCKEDFCPSVSKTLRNKTISKGRSKKMTVNPLSYRKTVEGLTRRTYKYTGNRKYLERDLEKLLDGVDKYSKRAVKELGKELSTISKKLDTSLSQISDVEEEEEIPTSMENFMKLRNKYAEYYSVMDLVKHYSDKRALYDYYAKVLDQDYNDSYDLNQKQVRRFQKNLDVLDHLMSNAQVEDEYFTYKKILK